MRDFLTPVETVEPRPTDPERSRYVRSYLIMRIVVGALGVALPFLLVLVDGLWLDGDPFPRTSLSAYYYSGVRELFVGALSAIGIFLITYKVAESSLDNTLSLLAGAAVIVVALLPTGRPDDVLELTPLQDRLGESAVETTHFVAAAVFIGSLAVNSYFFGKREGTALPPWVRRRHRAGAAVDRRHRALGLGAEELAALRRGRGSRRVRRLLALEGPRAGHASRTPRATGGRSRERALARARGAHPSARTRSSRGRPAEPVGLPGRARAFQDGANLAPERAVGRRTWEEFLADRAGARRRPRGRRRARRARR